MLLFNGPLLGFLGSASVSPVQKTLAEPQVTLTATSWVLGAGFCGYLGSRAELRCTVWGQRAQLGNTGSLCSVLLTKLNILYLETALEQINATALLPDKILFQVPVVLMAFSGCFDSSAGSCPKKHIVISQAFFCSERGTRRYCCVGRGCVLCKRLTGK